LFGKTRSGSGIEGDPAVLRCQEAAHFSIFNRAGSNLPAPMSPACRSGLSLLLLCPYNRQMATCINALNPAHRRRIPG
jgi:hypothetical protein